MNITASKAFFLMLLASSCVWAAEQSADPNAARSEPSSADAKTLPQVDSTDAHVNDHSLSSTLERGIDNQGLTMQEKWDDNVIVCKQEKVTGSRLTKKVCHSRGEWRAMKTNAFELTREITRRDRGGSER